MPLLTIFSTPKPFSDPHIRLIQRNAIQSWLHLEDADVLLIGQEEDMAEVCDELGVRHLPNVARNEWGTPLLSSIFALAREHSASPLLCFVNADILLLPDLVQAARRARAAFDAFLLIGRRWDLDLQEPLEFASGWAQRLRARVQQQGCLHAPAGSDYFVFPRGQFAEMPDFAIGRAGWDNWAIFHARRQGWPTIDATQDVMIVHQNHDYAHLPGGQPHYDQQESRINIRMARGLENDYTGYMLLDSDKEMRDGKIRSPRLSLLRIVRRMELAIMPPGKSGPRWSVTRRLRKLRRRLLARGA